MQHTELTRIHFVARASTVADGQSQIAWADAPAASRLLAGFGLSDGDETQAKTLDYEEVVYVIEGCFGVEIDGVLHTGQAGEVLHLPAGSVVRYTSCQARIFFVITRPE